MVEILRTKLFTPRPRSNLVSRRRLIESLNAGLDRKLTLLAAPAGFGKTTLLSEWIPNSPRYVTWLSLDEGDNDPIQFWSYFITALQQLRPDLGASALVLLQSPQSLPISSILTALINDLSTFPSPFSIVVDDYHAIDFQPIHEALTFLIEHLPQNMHLVLSTRSDPPLPLARLRARDQLTELRASNLRFTPEEAAAFLNQAMELTLTAAQVASLEARTEGWITGLQLAALSMRDHENVAGFIQAFSGSHKHILGFLAEEVINHQSEDWIQFLLQTSVLDRLCGPLCDAVTEQTNSASTLKDMEKANLFIVPLDDEGVWYRYHHLFAEVLQLRLMQAQPSWLPELHRRAQQWFERNGWMHDAVNHAIAAQDFEGAARLIEGLVAAKWQTGEIKALQNWLSALPVGFWRKHPRLWLVQAWVAMTVGNYVEGDANLRAAEESLSLLSEEETARVQPEITAFRASYASLIQDASAIELAEKALRELPTDYWMRGMLIVFLGGAHYAKGNLDTALAQLHESNLPNSDVQLHRIHVLALRGTIQHAQGKLNAALSSFQTALEAAELGGKPVPFVGTFFTYISLGFLLYEQNQLAQAEMTLTRCESMAADVGNTEIQVVSLSLLARIRLAQDHLATAAKYYHQIDAMLRQHTFSPAIMAHLEYHRFLLALRQGNLAAAAAWADERAKQTGPLNSFAFHRVALPQILIAEGKCDKALNQLTALIQETEDAGLGSLLIKALLLQALALDGSGSNVESLLTLRRALTLAEPEGFIRSFVDEGEQMRSLLLGFQANMKGEIKNVSNPSVIQLLSYTNKLLSAFPQAVGVANQGFASLLEPLSERELEILLFLSKGFSNKEIADLLVIAESTVKSHINNLYSKLGTHKRTQAIAIARDLGLLPD